MRVLANIPHAEFSITIFSWNQKYLLKFEMNNLEQTYKISELDITGIQEIEEMCQDESFLRAVASQFEQMENTLAQLLQNHL